MMARQGMRVIAAEIAGRGARDGLELGVEGSGRHRLAKGQENCDRGQQTEERPPPAQPMCGMQALIYQLNLRHRT